MVDNVMQFLKFTLAIVTGAFTARLHAPNE